MALPEQDRSRTSTAFQRYCSTFGLGLDLTKTQLRAAVDAVDDWCDTNATSFNQTIPAAARSALTPAEKALLLAYVAMRRAGALKVDEDG